MINEAGEEYSFKLDLAGRVVKERGFDGRTIAFGYDRAGRCNEAMNGRKKRTRIERDALGRVVKQVIPRKPVTGGGPAPCGEEVEYAFDVLGNLVRPKNDTIEVIFRRDALGRLTEERAGMNVVESRYDEAGHRMGRRTSVGHETLYDVDGNGALVAVTVTGDPHWQNFSLDSLANGRPVMGPWKVTLSRDALGNEVQRRLPGEIIGRWDRDRTGRPQTHRVVRNDEQVLGIGYRWRSFEQLAGLIDTIKGPIWYQHDARSYLVSATREGGMVEYRAPDAVGNVYRSAVRTDRRYGKGGRLEEADGVQFLHDDDGQLIEKVMPNGTRQRYEWDHSGQLEAVTLPDGQRVVFSYDALHRRVMKTFAGLTMRHVWDSDELVHELVEGTTPVTWVIEPGTYAPLVKIDGGNCFAVVTDHIGTPLVLFDEAGELAWKAELDTFGEARASVVKTSCPWRWPGQYEDETAGLYYNRFRYYDPEVGRYISPDPIRLIGGIGLYEYPSDPNVYFDPLGLTKCSKKPWIKRDVFRKLPIDAGHQNTKKFIAALKKGTVGPVGESGIKILDPPMPKYTHELKIGGSAARIFGYVTEHGYILFDVFSPRGLH